MSTGSRKYFLWAVDQPSDWVFFLLCAIVLHSQDELFLCLHPQLLEVRAPFQGVVLSVQPAQKGPQNSLMFLCKYN